MKFKKGIVALSMLVFGLNALAQQTVNTAGGNASGSGGAVSYSVGQVAYTTSVGTIGYVTSGVQQVYEISTVSINEKVAINISLSVFPNPTTNNLNLLVKDFDVKKLCYQLLDMQGKLLESKQLEASETFVNTAALSPATYFINVMQQDKKIKSFKIIKN